MVHCSGVVDPPISEKIRLLHYMDQLGISTADIGLPGAGPRAVDAVTALAQEVVDSKLSIDVNCAARTVLADVRPIADISQKVGIAIEAATFIGSSPIRQYAEDWTLAKMLRVTEESVTFAVREGLPVMMVTEDTTRAHPDVLKQLYSKAIEWGARRLCIADTVGHATPAGVTVARLDPPGGPEAGGTLVRVSGTVPATLSGKQALPAQVCENMDDVLLRWLERATSALRHAASVSKYGAVLLLDGPCPGEASSHWTRDSMQTACAELGRCWREEAKDVVVLVNGGEFPVVQHVPQSMFGRCNVGQPQQRFPLSR